MLSIPKLRAHHAKSKETIRKLRSTLHHRNLLITDLKAELSTLKSNPHHHDNTRPNPR